MSEESGTAAPEPENARSAAPHKARALAAMGLVLSAVFTVLTFVELKYGPEGIGLEPRMDSADLARALRALDWSSGGLFVLLTAATLPLRAWRWGMVLSPRGHFADRYHASAVGFMAINLLPARVGEVSRGLVLAARVPGIGRAQAVGSVVLVRILDLIALCVLCLPLPLLVVPADEAVPLLASGLFVLVLSSVGAIALIHLARKHGERAGQWISKNVGQRGGELFARFCAGLGPSSDGIRLLGATSATVLIQAVSALAYAPVIARLAPEVEPITSAALTLGVVSLGLSIPSAPSGVGLYHFALVWGLQAVGVEAADAAAVAIVTHLGSIVAFVVPGAISLVVTGMPLEAMWGQRIAQPKQSA